MWTQLVTRSRGRETDKKRVAVEIYDAGNAQQRDGDAKRTADRSSLSLFLYLWCGVYCTQNCSVRPQFFFPYFFTERKIGHRPGA
jgi:hypothetical protein